MSCSLKQLHVISTYLSELKYIRNIFQNTLVLYGYAFNQGRGLLSCVTMALALNAYFRWLHIEHGKGEEKIISIFNPEQVTLIINWKPVGGAESRLKALTEPHARPSA